MGDRDPDSVANSDGVRIRLVADNRVVAAFLAIIFGGGASIGVLRYTPVAEEVVRPNPHTSIDEARNRKEDRDWNEAEREELRDEIKGLGVQMLALETRMNNRVNDAELHSQQRHQAQDVRINDLARLQGLDDQHRVEAGKGYDRIRKCEQDIATLNAEVGHCREQMRDVRSEMGH